MSLALCKHQLLLLMLIKVLGNRYNCSPVKGKKLGHQELKQGSNLDKCL